MSCLKIKSNQSCFPLTNLSWFPFLVLANHARFIMMVSPSFISISFHTTDANLSEFFIISQSFLWMHSSFFLECFSLFSIWKKLLPYSPNIFLFSGLDRWFFYFSPFSITEGITFYFCCLLSLCHHNYKHFPNIEGIKHISLTSVLLALILSPAHTDVQNFFTELINYCGIKLH